MLHQIRNAASGAADYRRACGKCFHDGNWHVVHLGGIYEDICLVVKLVDFTGRDRAQEAHAGET